jgi:hypothetical protein
LIVGELPRTVLDASHGPTAGTTFGFAFWFFSGKTKEENVKTPLP